MKPAELNKRYAVNSRTSLDRFKPGMEVKVETLDLAEYDWTNPNHPEPPLKLCDVPLLTGSRHFVGVVTMTDDDDEITVLADKTSTEHTLARAQIVAVTATGQRPVHLVPSRFMLATLDSYGDETTPRTLTFQPGVGVVQGTAVVDPDGLLAAAMVIGLDVGARKLRPIRVGQTTYHWTLDTEKQILKVGCWRVRLDEAERFLRWAVERVSVGGE